MPTWLHNNVDPRRRAVTRLRAELSPRVCNQPPSEGRCANCRSSPRLQKVEPVSDPQALAFASGRVGRSCLEEDPIKIVVQGDRCELFLHDRSNVGSLLAKQMGLKKP
jgi:hypothetical protein